MQINKIIYILLCFSIFSCKKKSTSRVLSSEASEELGYHARLSWDKETHESSVMVSNKEGMFESEFTINSLVLNTNHSEPGYIENANPDGFTNLQTAEVFPTVSIEVIIKNRFLCFSEAIPIGELKLLKCIEIGEQSSSESDLNVYKAAVSKRLINPVYWIHDQNSMQITYADKKRSYDIADLWLVKTLEKTFKELKESPLKVRGFDHKGIYNDRNIAGSSRVSRHSYALAIDIGEFTLEDGTKLSVLKDWNDPVKGPKLMEIRNIFCNNFDTVLSPLYNKNHKNHFHIDLNPEKRSYKEPPLPSWGRLALLPEYIRSSLLSPSSSSFALTGSQDFHLVEAEEDKKTCK